MGEARAGNENMRGVLVIDRRKDPPLFERPVKIDGFADPAVRDQFAKRDLLGDRLARQVERRARASHHPAFAARRHRERPLPVLVHELGKSHERSPSFWSTPERAAISARIRGSVKSAAAMVAPAAIRTSALNVVVRPTTARPAAAAAQTPDSESSKATERAAPAPVRSRPLR